MEKKFTGTEVCFDCKEWHVAISMDYIIVSKIGIDNIDTLSEDEVYTLMDEDKYRGFDRVDNVDYYMSFEDKEVVTAITEAIEEYSMWREKELIIKDYANGVYTLSDDTKYTFHDVCDFDTVEEDRAYVMNEATGEIYFVKEISIKDKKAYSFVIKQY